jgi:hypothetical protein
MFHVLAIEFPIVRKVKFGANVRKIEIRPVLLRHTVDSLQVADPLSLNQGTDGSTTDAQCDGPTRIKVCCADQQDSPRAPGFIRKPLDSPG